MKSLINRIKKIFIKKIDKEQVLNELLVEVTCFEIDLIDDSRQSFGVELNHNGYLIILELEIDVNVQPVFSSPYLDPIEDPLVNIQVSNFYFHVYNSWEEEVDHDFTNDDIKSILKHIEITN